MDKKQMDSKSVKIRRLDKKIKIYSDIVKSISELSAASSKKVGCMAIKNDFSKSIDDLVKELLSKIKKLNL